MGTVVYFLDSNTREIYIRVNERKCVCCVVREGVSLPAMERFRARHETNPHEGQVTPSAE